MLDNKIFLDLEKDNIVIFLDILGFSKKICEISKYQETIENCIREKTPTECICNLPNIYNTVVNFDNSNEIQADKGFKFMWISDSIILASKYDNVGVILDRVASMSKIFLTFNMLIRGGMSCGDLYYKDNVVGVPYIEAVNLEKTAKYPRVLISEENFEIVKPYLKNSQYKFMSEFFKKTDGEEYWEFDFIEYNILGGPKSEFNVEILQSYVSVFINEMNSLCNGDKKSENAKILEKYVWFGKKLIEIINRYSKNINEDQKTKNNSDFKNSEEMISEIRKYRIIDVL